MPYLYDLFGIALVVILTLVLFVSTRPAAFVIQRTAIVAAPVATVFALIEDFHQWSKWSPWERLDPALQRFFSGPQKGTGAIYGWSGNKKAGSGRMTILESVPEQKVVIKLDFIKPFAATNEAAFALAPADGGTKVTWTMTGHRPFIMKAFFLVMDMDKLVGGDFEKGLANMNAAVK